MKPLVINLDKDVHSSFKSWCAGQGMTMKEVITESIMEKIKKPVKEKVEL